MNIMQGDCHEVTKTLEKNSIDIIYTDPPFAYGKKKHTECDWDLPLRWEELFKEMWRTLKPNGVIILHCSIPFTYHLIQCETRKNHYTWIKDRSTNFFHAKSQPLRQSEEVLVIYKKQPTYNPQMIGNTFYKTGRAGKSDYFGNRTKTKVEGNDDGHIEKYPNNILNYPRCIRGFSTRPDALIDFILKTYSNETDTVLDLTCYNGLTGHRCAALKRQYIGVDLNPVNLI